MLEIYVAKFHVACPRGTRVLKTRVPRGIWPYQDAKTESQRLDLKAQNRAFDLELLKMYILYKPALLTK